MAEVVIRMDPGLKSARALAEVKRIAAQNPGEHEIVLRVGERRLALGDLWKVAATPETKALFREYGKLVLWPD
jgi:hypothetical protein